jgi:hypothetical protein
LTHGTTPSVALLKDARRYAKMRDESPFEDTWLKAWRQYNMKKKLKKEKKERRLKREHRRKEMEESRVERETNNEERHYRSMGLYPEVR